MDKQCLYFDFGNFEVKIPYELQANGTEIKADLTTIIIQWQ
jgi:hypothetical protein